MKTTVMLVLFSVLTASALQSQQTQQPPPNDPIGEHLFPPELIMQNQKTIGLNDDQRNFIKTEMQKAQSRFTDVQWQLQSEVETLSSMLKQDKVDEQQVVAQLEKVLNLEREVKRTQITLVIRIKNKLSVEQQIQLRELKIKIQAQSQAREREGRKLMEER